MNLIKSIYRRIKREIYAKRYLVLFERNMELKSEKFSGNFKGEIVIYHDEINLEVFNKYFAEDIEDIKYLCSVGVYCSVMLHKGNAVGYLCIADKDYHEKALNYTFTLKDKQIYQFAGVVHPRFRHTSIMHDGFVFSWNYFKEKGYDSVLDYVDDGNIPSMKVHARLGFNEVGEQLVYSRWFSRKKTYRESYTGEKLLPYRK